MSTEQTAPRHIITWKFEVLKKVPTGLRLALLLASQSLTRGWATLRLIPDPGCLTSSSLISPDSRPSSSSLIPVRRSQLPALVSAARGPRSLPTYLLSEAAGHVVGVTTHREQRNPSDRLSFWLPVKSSPESLGPRLVKSVKMGEKQTSVVCQLLEVTWRKPATKCCSDNNCSCICSSLNCDLEQPQE